MFEVGHGDYDALFRGLVRRMVLVSVVPLLVVATTNSYLFHRLNRMAVIERQTSVVRHHREAIGSFLSGRTAELSTLARQYSLEELLDGNLERVFRVIQERSEVLTDIGIIDSRGDHLLYIGPFDLRDRNYRGQPWFEQVVAHGEYVSDVFLGLRGVPHFVIAVKRQERDRFWILRATVNTEYFSRLVDAARTGRTGEVFIVNSQGFYQTRTRITGELLTQSGYPERTPYRDIRVREHELGGKSYLCTTAWLDRPRWLLIFREELGEVYGPAWNSLLIGLVIFLMGALAAGALAVGVARGVTDNIRQTDREKASLARRLVVTGKTAAIGEMSAGLAHEINNPLATIDTLQTWIRDLAQDSPVREEDRTEILASALKIGGQVERCKTITQGLLKFSRRIEAKPEPLDLNGVLSELCTMARTRARVENATLVVNLAPLPPIVSSSTHLQQIFVNLVNNAIDAVASRHDGRVSLTSGLEGDKVKVTVADNGCGIPPENLTRIFVPFFTTKPVGRGTGLGLAICHGLVHELGGSIHCDSAVGVGTTFTVLLPLRPAGYPVEARADAPFVPVVERRSDPGAPS